MHLLVKGILMIQFVQLKWNAYTTRSLTQNC